MLIDFSVANFRSYGAEQTLNLVASRAQKGHEDHCVDIPETDERVLRVAVIYGANGSGKSNLVAAMHFAQNLVLEGPGPLRRLALSQFRFTEESPRPSSFEFRFLVDDRVFVYGFEATKDEITEEWLSATNQNGRDADIFHRQRKEIVFGDLEKFGESDPALSEALKALQLLGVRPNQLLLNKIVDLDPERRGRVLSQAVGWFTECLSIIPPTAYFASIVKYLDEDAAFRAFAAEFLDSVGTGVRDITVEQTRLLAEKLPKSIIEDLQSTDAPDSERVVGPGISLSLDPDDPAIVIRRNLVARHTIGNRDFSLSFDEESDGTQRFLHLLPALYHLRAGGKVFVIDELDRSLHPLLAHAFVKFFTQSCPGALRQLVVTTHESHLLDQDLLRRDEIWFTEKDAAQQTHLYSLTDMNVRNDLRLEKSYLQGRFGAIPFVGGMDKLSQLLVECPPEP